MIDSYVLLAYASLAASRTLLQQLLVYLNFTLDSEDLLCWYKWKKWFIWTMAGFDNWHTLHTYVCLLLLVYTWFWTCVCWQTCSFFPMFSKSFQDFSGSSMFLLFKNLLLYIWPLIYLFVIERDTFFTVYIYFKETLFFNFSYKLFNKNFLLPQRICQFRVAVKN